MKKQILVLTLMLVLVSFLIADNVQFQKMLKAKKTNTTKNTREDVIHYSNDFETPFTWTHYDGSIPAHTWHLTNNTSLTYGGTGYSWFPGQDELGTNGGYLDRQYIVLDTPVINVPTANPTLTFKMKFKVEAIGSSPDLPQYNGWDALNVRISINGGQTWTVLTGLPAYSATSMYGFGFHGEGTNIPGWGGNSTAIAGNTNGWVNASFDLAAYQGQDVKIRFAFASDPAQCTTDDASLFGWVVDNIVLGTFNGVFDTNDTMGMVPGTPVPLGGDEWHIAEYPQAPSPSHVLSCTNAQGTYNVGMMNYVETELITLPQSENIHADFQIRGSFTDPDEFPEVEYFGWEISIDNGVSWRAMSNPTANEDSTNYVYSDVPDAFTSFVEGYNGNGHASGNVSFFAGQPVKFRWYFRSDADAPNGEGIMIDDFKIVYSQFSPAPTNLTAVRSGSAINLAWTVPTLNNRELEGYKVYRSTTSGSGYTMISEIGATSPSYVDASPVANSANYYVVTTIWSALESQYSNEAAEYMHTDTTHELFYHDGVAENGIASSGSIASLYTPIYHGTDPINITALKFFVHTKTANNLQLKIWDATGTEGTPGTELFGMNLVSAQIQPGWNYVVLPAESQVTLTSGSFYIGFQMTAASPKIGIDTGNHGRSYTKTGSNGPWTSVIAGNYLINAFYDNGSGSSDIIINPTKLTACNYPNPFNPETSIQFNMPTNGQVSVKIFNTKGQIVRELFNGKMEQGHNELVWKGVDNNGKNVSSGIYFYQIKTSNQSIMNKMMLIK